MAVRVVTEPVSAALARGRMVFEALSLLTPFDLPGERKLRIGEPGDGSYVLIDRLDPSQPIMSFGVGPSTSFETGIAERGHAKGLHQFPAETLAVVARGAHGQAAGWTGVTNFEAGYRGCGMVGAPGDTRGFACSVRADRLGTAPPA